MRMRIITTRSRQVAFAFAATDGGLGNPESDNVPLLGRYLRWVEYVDRCNTISVGSGPCSAADWELSG